MTPLELVIIGAGQRGGGYASFAHAHPEDARIVAVAEPNPFRRKRMAEEHDLDDAHCFADWRDLIDAGKLGQGAIVTTQDQMHVEPAIAAMQAGYHVLLEKPMAPDLAGCVQLVQASERTGRILQICHVLRYSPFWVKLHEILASERLGRIITVEHRENVSFWHMAHSFVRGNWGNTERSNPMILAKSCHDLDILYWNLGGVRRLSSFGSLLHYRPESVSAEIPLRCTDGCPIERQCPFSALGIYLEGRPFQQMAAQMGKPYTVDLNQPDTWPFTAIGEDMSVAGRMKALQEGPYGRCVYHCDNDVVDNQVISMEMESGASVAMVMHGHSHEEGRTMRYDGTRATLRARFTYTGEEMYIHDHLTGTVEAVNFQVGRDGHGGGDAGIMRDFTRALRGETAPLTSARESLESHLMAFAAEEARQAGMVVKMEEYRQSAERLKG